MAVTAGLSLLMLILLPVAAQKQPVYVEIGRTLKLNPNYTKAITMLTWKHNRNLVAEYIKDSYPLEYIGDLKGRTNVDLSTGVLTISNVNQSDSGEFTVEINHQVLPVSFVVAGIRKLDGYPVEVSVRPKGCSSLTSKNCTLVCGGQFQGAEPVQYFWKTGKTEQWKEGNKTFSISRRFSDYTCKVKNPISEKQSKPFQSSSGPVPLPAILLVAVLAIGATFVV
uniref:Ig-like domain-containing protein n=1 Tax=Poecilia mexicana TaxID=48701 RepID=A0A3B3WEL3_9TELE